MIFHFISTLPPPCRRISNWFSVLIYERESLILVIAVYYTFMSTWLYISSRSEHHADRQTLAPYSVWPGFDQNCPVTLLPRPRWIVLRPEHRGGQAWEIFNLSGTFLSPPGPLSVSRPVSAWLKSSPPVCTEFFLWLKVLTFLKTTTVWMTILVSMSQKYPSNL